MASGLSDRKITASMRDAVHDQNGFVKRSVSKTKHVKLNFKRLAISVAVFAFCIYFVCMTFSQQKTINAKKRELEELNTQITAANNETESLREEYDSVSEPEYLERMAREKLGLVRPNERVYIDVSSGK